MLEFVLDRAAFYSPFVTYAFGSFSGVQLKSLETAISVPPVLTEKSKPGAVVFDGPDLLSAMMMVVPRFVTVRRSSATKFSSTG